MSSTISDLIASEISDARAAMREAATEVIRQRHRIEKLETVLGRMVVAHETTCSDSEGRWPHPDTGCIECTVGAVPDRLNTGLCAYHEAKRLLGRS